MGRLFSVGILDNEVVEVASVDQVGDVLLDERHLSKSALRALDVLEFFAMRQRPARATEVAHSLGLSTSTADQLLKTLASRAYVLFDIRTKLYSPSPRLLGFANVLETTYFGGDTLRALMHELMERSGLAVTLSTPFGRMMQVVDYDLPEGHCYVQGPGFLFPLFSSAAGSATLATWPTATVESLVSQSGDQLGHLAHHPELVLERLDAVRANGHAFGGLSLDAEMGSIALALPRSKSGSDLAVSLRGQLGDLRSRRWRLAAMMQEIVSSHLRPDTELH